MDGMSLLLVWCGILVFSVSVCHSDSDPFCELSIDVDGTNICYWIISTRQNALSSEAECKLGNGTLAYIPNEDALLETSALMERTLHSWSFAYVGYKKSSQGDIIIQGTNITQSWVTWDSFYGQPNGSECVVLFTFRNTFHYAFCSQQLYALCSTPYETAETDVSTDATNDRTPAVTHVVNLEFNDEVLENNIDALNATNDPTTDVTPDVNPGANDEVLKNTIDALNAINDRTTDVNPDVNPGANDEVLDINTDASNVANDGPTDVTSDATPDVTPVPDNNINSTPCCDCYTRPSIVIHHVVNITKELQAKLDTLKKETKVDEENLSSTIRKRISASDPRPSSAYVGYLGIALLTLIFGGTLLLELPRVIMALKTFC